MPGRGDIHTQQCGIAVQWRLTVSQTHDETEAHSCVSDEQEKEDIQLSISDAGRFDP